MKKRFIEPEMQRIELNLRENIATSADNHAYIKLLSSDYAVCTVQNTGKFIFAGLTEQEVRSCTVYGMARSFGANVPIEELLPYIRH